MDNSVWIAMIIVAIGTLLMRLLPLHWMQRSLAKKQADHSLDHLPLWLSVLGPTMIAAMFGTSLVPASPSLATWLATAAGGVTTLIAWYWKRTLGLPVFAGVLAFGLVYVVMQ